MGEEILPRASGRRKERLMGRTGFRGRLGSRKPSARMPMRTRLELTSGSGLSKSGWLMAASGHERHSRGVRGTSALPPILTVTADIPDRQLGARKRHMHCSKNSVAIRSPPRRGRAASPVLRGPAPWRS
jgi:hypothetical protein